MIAMAVNAARLRHMILGTGQHHQHAPAPVWLIANQPDTSTAAAPMPMSYAAAVPGQQGYQSPYVVTPPPPPLPPVGGQDQYTEFLALAAVDLAKRGVSLHGSLSSREMIAGYKRKRDEQSAPVLGAAYTQQQPQTTIVVDRLLLNHASKMWEALAKQRKRHMRLITSAVAERAAKRLKGKDEQMEHLRGVNWGLQVRLRNLEMEAQMWRDVARSNEAAANVLRGDLQRALDAQAVRGRGVCSHAEDASSCCWGDDEYTVRKPEAVVASVGRCKGCGQGEAVVLLLPCRHLSVCVSCAAAVRACPACGCAKTGSIWVNFP